MSVTKVIKYHVSVQIPDEIWERYRESQEYHHMSCNATTGNIEAGSNGYADPEEWADFWHEHQAKECEQKLLNMIAHFRTKLNKDKEQDNEQ